MSDKAKYPAYKDSGVEWIGEVPAHWEVVRAKYLWKEKSDLSENGTEELLSVSQYKGIQKNTGEPRSSSFEGYKRVKEGDLVINIMLAWMGGLGVSSLQGIVSPAYAIYTGNEKIYPGYFHYLYRTKAYLTEFARRSTGVIPSRWRMYTDSFGEVRTILPPLPEQQRIAHYLDLQSEKIDRAIAQKRRLVALLKERKQVAIQRAVTKGLQAGVPMKDSGVEWIGEVPEGWEVVRAKYLWREKSDLSETGREQLLSVSQYEGIRKNTGESRSSSFEGYKRVEKGDLVINIMLAWMGGLGVSSLKGIVSPAYAIYTGNNKIHSKYFHYLYRTKAYLTEFARRSTGVIPSRWRMYTDSFGEVRTILPPLSEQREIAAHLEAESKKIDHAIALQERQALQLEEYRRVLVDVVVRGGVRV